MPDTTPGFGAADGNDASTSGLANPRRDRSGVGSGENPVKKPGNKNPKPQKIRNIAVTWFMFHLIQLDLCQQPFVCGGSGGCWFIIGHSQLFCSSSMMFHDPWP